MTPAKNSKPQIKFSQSSAKLQSKLNTKLIAVAVAVLLLLVTAACAAGMGVAPSDQEIPTATAPIVETLTPTPTPMPAYTVMAATGEYTQAQIDLNNSQSVKVQQERMQKWLDYWVIFDNRPFDLTTEEIHWKFIYDDIKNPSEVLTLLEVGGEYEGRLFTVPVAKGDWQAMPPGIGINQTEIGEGFGPLELSGGDYVLSVQEGIPVRRDGTGRIMEKLDMESGQWEKASLIEGNIFYDPRSVEDIKNVVLAPSPFDDAEKFALWQEEYLKLVNEKIVNGGNFTIIDREGFGIQFDRSNFVFHSQTWVSIASYKYNYKGEELLNRTYVLRNAQDFVFPQTVTDLPKDSWYNINSGGDFPTEESKEVVYIFYGYSEKLKKIRPDSFLEEFFSQQESNQEDIVLDVIYRDAATQREVDKFQRLNFVLWGWQEDK